MQAPVTPSPSGPPARLDVEDLVVVYGGARAVDGVSLTVPAGQILGIVGPNGAGKSSLLAAVGGQLRPAGGRIRLDGADVTRLAPHRRARRGVTRTFQDTSEFGRLTVFENLLVAGLGERGASFLDATVGARAQARRTAAAAATSSGVTMVIELNELTPVAAVNVSISMANTTFSRVCAEKTGANLVLAAANRLTAMINPTSAFVPLGRSSWRRGLERPPRAGEWRDGGGPPGLVFSGC